MALSAPAFAEWGPTVDGFIKHSNRRTLGGVDALLPLRQDGNSLFFADIKGHLSSHDSNEVNLGLGYRQLTAEGKWALGAYAAWDNRRSELGNNYSQITLGAEARGERLDVRANVYTPITDKKLTGLGSTSHFAGFGVWRNGVYEEAMRGYDLEVGALLPISSTVETRLYLAGYSFKGEDVAPRASGYRARVEARVNQNMTFGVSTQHDDVFGTANFLEFRYTFGKEPKSSIRTVKERMAEPWTRDIDIVISKPTESTNPIFSQQTSDRAVHVNSAAAEGGDGSYEHPYNSVVNCESAKCGETTDGIGTYNMIRLWQGNSLSTAYTPATLQDGQTLWGQGIDIYTGRTQAGLYPVIDSSSGEGVRLASNTTLGNTVTGVKITGTGTGITGGNTWGTVRLSGNIIDVSGNGINLYNSISDGSTRSQSVSIANNTISAASAAYSNGIAIGNYAGYGSTITQATSISGNTIHSQNSSGIRLSNNAQYDSATITQTASISGNTISGSQGVNIDTYADDSGVIRQNIAISGNTINVDGEGIYIRSSGDEGAIRSQTVTISGNIITSANSNGIEILNQAGGYGAATTSSQTVTITDNTVSAEGSGIVLSNQAYHDGSVATQTATISNNTISAGNTGIYASNSANAYYSTNTATQNLTISGNTVTAPTGIALSNNASTYNYYYPGTASQTATISGNTLRSTEGNTGIAIWNGDNGNHDAIQDVTISGANTLSGFSSGVYAYRNTSHPSSAQTVNVSGVTLTGLPSPSNAIMECGYGTQNLTIGSGNTGNGTAITTATRCSAPD